MIKIYSVTPLNLVKFHEELHEEFGNVYINTTDTHINIDIEDTIENTNTIKALILAHDKDAAELTEAKSNKVSQLWQNVVVKQEKFFYESDKIEARGVVRQGTANNLVACTSIKSWIDDLYALYYTKKSSVYGATSLEDLNLVVINFNTVANPVYSNDSIWS